MCGLVGFITNKNYTLDETQQWKRKHVFNGLLIAMQDRGLDSTGIMALSDKTYIFKKAVDARTLIKNKEYIKLMDRDNKIVIGHTRYGTTGAVTDDNSHPFVFDNIVGAHNGHVTNYLEIYDKSEVDSEAIFYNLNKYDNDYKKAFKELQGKFAITWVNLKEANRVYIARSDNPMAIAFVKELQTTFWCSIDLALETVLVTMGLSASIWEPKENHCYTLTNEGKTTKQAIEFKKYTWVSKWEDNTKDTTSKNYQDAWDNEDEKSELPRNSAKVSETLYMNDDQLREMGLKVQEKACTYCGSSIDVKEFNGFWWDWDLQAILCDKCIDESEDMMVNDETLEWITLYMFEEKYTKYQERLVSKYTNE